MLSKVASLTPKIFLMIKIAALKRLIIVLPLNLFKIVQTHRKTLRQKII